MTFEAELCFAHAIPSCGIKADDIRFVSIDGDYVSSAEDELQDWILNELETKYNYAFSWLDYKILNLSQLLDDLDFNDVRNKTYV